MNAVLNKDIIKTITDAPLVNQDTGKTELESAAVTDVERKKVEALKRIDAFIDRHEPLLVKLAK